MMTSSLKVVIFGLSYDKITQILGVLFWGCMNIIYLLIPLSLMLFAVAIWAIRYAVKSNQFEDLDNAPDQIILDDRQARRELDHQGRVS